VFVGNEIQRFVGSLNQQHARKGNGEFVGRQKPENSSASKLPDQLRDGTACFSGTSIVARDLEVLRSLSFRAICEFTRRLYVPSGDRPYLASAIGSAHVCHSASPGTICASPCLYASEGRLLLNRGA
jgi:hypothetical protein